VYCSINKSHESFESLLRLALVYPTILVKPVYDASTARKQLLQRVHGAHMAG